jgi:hypothetical protein
MLKIVNAQLPTYLIRVPLRDAGHARLPFRSAPALHAGNRLPLALSRRAASRSCFAAHPSRLKLPELMRDHENARTELAAEALAPPDFLLRGVWRWRRRRRPGSPAWQIRTNPR